jgi:hypothetical protein
VHGQRIRLHGIDARLSLVEGESGHRFPATPCLLIAEAVEEVGADRFCATIVPVG